MDRAAVLKEIERIRDQIVEKYRPDKIILFGSAAGKAEEINDIDIFILKRDIPYLGSDRIRQLYRLVETDYPVDFIVYSPDEANERISKGDPFIKRIFNKGKVLYG